MAWKHLPPETIERARALWHEGLSASRIGDAVGLSKNSIVSMARRYSFPARPSPLGRHAAAATLEQAVEMRRAGMAVPSVAQRLGLSQEVLYRRAPLDGPKPARGRAAPLSPEQREAVGQMLASGVQAVRIAEATGATFDQITRVRQAQLASNRIAQPAPTVARRAIGGPVQVSVARYVAPAPPAPKQRVTPHRSCQMPLWGRRERADLASIRFCSEPAVPGYSWCAACHGRVFVRRVA